MRLAPCSRIRWWHPVDDALVTGPGTAPSVLPSVAAVVAAALAVDALEMAVARRGPGEVTGCVVHADRGNQFRARPYVAALHRAGLVGSMGRVASSADNAAMESFFALLQKERPKQPPVEQPR